jgi:hypothetical protein
MNPRTTAIAAATKTPGHAPRNKYLSRWTSVNTTSTTAITASHGASRTADNAKTAAARIRATAIVSSSDRSRLVIAGDSVYLSLRDTARAMSQENEASVLPYSAL